MQYNTTNGNSIVSNPKPQVGYHYRDIIEHPQYDEKLALSTKSNSDPTFVVQLAIRDFKFLTNYIAYNQTVGYDVMF
jgi:hypothetical protein